MSSNSSSTVATTASLRAKCRSLLQLKQESEVRLKRRLAEWKHRYLEETTAAESRFTEQLDNLKEEWRTGHKQLIASAARCGVAVSDVRATDQLPVSAVYRVAEHSAGGGLQTVCPFYTSVLPKSTRPKVPFIDSPKITTLFGNTQTAKTKIKGGKSQAAMSSRVTSVWSHASDDCSPRCLAASDGRPPSGLKRVEDGREYVCEHCGEAFEQKWQWNEHRFAHNNDWPFFCKVCGKGRPTRVLLMIHMQTHTGEFKCHFCDKVLTKRNGLVIHVRTHTGQRPYICKFGCGKRFSDPSSARSHQNKSKLHALDRENQRLQLLDDQ